MGWPQSARGLTWSEDDGGRSCKGAIVDVARIRSVASYVIGENKAADERAAGDLLFKRTHTRCAICDFTAGSAIRAGVQASWEARREERCRTGCV